MKAPFIPFDRPRGQPLLVLAMVLGGWLVVRVLLWEAPFAGEASARARAGLPAIPRHTAERSAAAEAIAAEPAIYGEGNRLLAVHSEALGALVAPARAQLPHREPVRLDISSIVPPAADACGDMAFSDGVCLSGIAGSIVRAESAPAMDGEPAIPASAPQAHVRRWSGDAWLLVRNGSAAPLAAGQPAYGRSQAGAVLRYRLVPSSEHRPVLYARATRALAGVQEGEVAAGLAARPLPALPVSVSAELRVHDSVAGREVRPAAFAVTELPPAELPLGLRGEAYVQAGYVGGTFATAFVDGQARVDGPLARLGDGAELRVGAAAWGGAQKHAERLDVGPSAAVSFRLGEVNSRLALDYRFRVAGDAEPQSGPALTFSAGF